MSKPVNYRRFAARLSRAGFPPQQVIEFLLGALNSHAEFIDDYETYLAQHFNTNKDIVHLCISCGTEWAKGKTTVPAPLIKKYQERVSA